MPLSQQMEIVLGSKVIEQITNETQTVTIKFTEFGDIQILIDDLVLNVIPSDTTFLGKRSIIVE